MSDGSTLGDRDLVDLVRSVFAPGPDDRRLTLLTDLPDPATEDEPDWRWRRELAADWTRRLGAATELGLEVELVLYRRTGAHNAELPSRGWRWRGVLPDDAAAAASRADEPLDEILATTDLVIAPTRFSTTAPLKLAARRHGLRAATMPGFAPAMVGALALDWTEVDRRVRRLAALLDRAERAELRFATPHGPLGLDLDLRHRRAHVSSGLLREPGTAGNLPSGEAYIVPYEGEREADPSRSAGDLPVQWGDEVVVYRVSANRAVAVTSEGPESEREARRLAAEPAYGNLAELGLGVLGPLGVDPIGSVLLDEKIGPHLAFGRSDHFGGQVGPADFRDPASVVHQDHVYLPATQPAIAVRELALVEPAGRTVLVRDDTWVIGFSGPAPRPPG